MGVEGQDGEEENKVQPLVVDAVEIVAVGGT